LKSEIYKSNEDIKKISEEKYILESKYNEQNELVNTLKASKNND